MKIGNIEFGPQPLFLAPMEDVTDIGFMLYRFDSGDKRNDGFDLFGAVIEFVPNQASTVR
jgi:tRNA-dihydrouridine synthase